MQTVSLRGKHEGGAIASAALNLFGSVPGAALALQHYVGKLLTLQERKAEIDPLQQRVIVHPAPKSLQSQGSSSYSIYNAALLIKISC